MASPTRYTEKGQRANVNEHHAVTLTKQDGLFGNK